MSDSTRSPEDETRSTPEQSSTEDPAMMRAEELVDRLGERVGYFASLLNQRARWAAARAREEAEDIWAEAQSIRRKKDS